MGWRDEWPTVDGIEYDGKNLLRLLEQGHNPFQGQWDPRQLIQEVETQLHVVVQDIPTVEEGSNNFV